MQAPRLEGSLSMKLLEVNNCSELHFSYCLLQGEIFMVVAISGEETVDDIIAAQDNITLLILMQPDTLQTLNVAFPVREI